MNTIQKADPAARRKAIWMVSAATVIGFFVILAFEYLQENIQIFLERHMDFLFENTIVVFLASLVFVSPLLVTGTYLLLLGNRTVRARRFPPPGYTVVRDIPILEGLPGYRRGRIIQLLSLFLLCCASLIPFLMWYIFSSFK